uniref:ATP synthase complex subunit 8 n=1 Tax=Limatus flavisetosus TaxID=1426897 RepID=A0A5B9H950_9DIPT|nr:ATP synthase F0 subunit 8 [Limatus flavisetosus]QEE94323.1 ATP synthase F0 subunit 8 [Limatus flavisetosus]
MPQMAPINWLILFIIFSITLMMFNMKIYYCNFPNMPQFQQSMTYKKNYLNWKW